MPKDLPGMPKKDEVGEAAESLVGIIRKQKRIAEERGEAADVLRDAMMRVNRPSITVEDVTFILQKKEAEEKVKVVWPR